jgi:hypothetical protein
MLTSRLALTPRCQQNTRGKVRCATLDGDVLAWRWGAVTVNGAHRSLCGDWGDSVVKGRKIVEGLVMVWGRVGMVEPPCDDSLAAEREKDTNALGRNA